MSPCRPLSSQAALTGERPGAPRGR